jgi:2-C-methyl-D-erythritol 2,4-cyclodiphosphate synthase
MLNKRVMTGKPFVVLGDFWRPILERVRDVETGHASPWGEADNRLVPGAPLNLKVTVPDDLMLAEALLRRDEPLSFAPRVGIGFDAHRLVSGRPLVLGGVTIPFSRGLEGHSDADVVAHAIMDALLGAAGRGDIGRLFPPDDPAFRGADSMHLLGRVRGLLAEQGWRAAHIDVVVMAEAPRLASHAEAMRAAMARALGTDPGKKLVTPRLIATLCMLPMLTVISDFVGLLGGFAVSFFIVHLNPSQYWSQAYHALGSKDLGQGLGKPFVFAFIVALVGCYYGLATRGGTQGVGRATTQAVVTASVLILATDFFLTKLILALGG